MTKEYRGRYAIITQILRTINDSDTEGVSRTAIMYNCFLSYTQLREYLSYLVEKDLINEFPEQFKSSGNEKFAYKITNKGLRFLQISLEFENLLGPDLLLN